MRALLVYYNVLLAVFRLEKLSTQLKSRVERGNLGYNLTMLPLTSHRSNPRRLRYTVFTKNYRETEWSLRL